jgi:hypothetical protein
MTVAVRVLMRRMGACLALVVLPAACATGSATDGATATQLDSGGPEPLGVGADAGTIGNTGPSGPPSPAGGLDSGTSGAVDSGAMKHDGSSAPLDSGGAATDAGGAIPTTCSEANGVVGCCGPNGESYYCATASSTTVKSAACTGGKVCGWNASKMYYSCVSPPATADPSGTEPIACAQSGGPGDAGTGGPDAADSGVATDAGQGDASTDAGVAGVDAAEGDGGEAGVGADAGEVGDGGGVTDAGAGQIPTTCAQADNSIGCCGPNGDLYYCSSGSLTSKTCTGGKVCGWNVTNAYYGCVTGAAMSDPSGFHPITCQ